MSHFFENERPFPMIAKDIRELVGKTIEFVLERDIDKSGRGYFNVKSGRIVEQRGRNICLENGEWYFWREIRVYRVVG